MLLYQFIAQQLDLLLSVFLIFLTAIQLLDHLLVIKGKLVIFLLQAVHVLWHLRRSKHGLALVASLNAFLSQILKLFIEVFSVHLNSLIFRVEWATLTLLVNRLKPVSKDSTCLVSMLCQLAVSLPSQPIDHETFRMFSIFAENLRETLRVVIITLGQRRFHTLGREFRPKVLFLDILILEDSYLITLLEEGFVQVWYQLTNGWIGSIFVLLALLRQRPAAENKLLTLVHDVLGCLHASHKLRGMVLNCLQFHKLLLPLIFVYLFHLGLLYCRLLLAIVSPTLLLLIHQSACQPHFWDIGGSDEGVRYAIEITGFRKHALWWHNIQGRLRNTLSIISIFTSLIAHSSERAMEFGPCAVPTPNFSRLLLVQDWLVHLALGSHFHCDQVLGHLLHPSGGIRRLGCRGHRRKLRVRHVEIERTQLTCHSRVDALVLIGVFLACNLLELSKQVHLFSLSGLNSGCAAQFPSCDTLGGMKLPTISFDWSTVITFLRFPSSLDNDCFGRLHDYIHLGWWLINLSKSCKIL